MSFCAPHLLPLAPICDQLLLTGLLAQAKSEPRAPGRGFLVLLRNRGGGGAPLGSEGILCFYSVIIHFTTIADSLISDVQKAEAISFVSDFLESKVWKPL